MPEELLSIHQSPTPDNVPKKELEQSVEDRKKELKDEARVKFDEWARLILQMVDGENSDEELRRVRKITKMMRYYRGEQRGFWSQTTGDWVPLNPDDFEARDAAMLLINNQIRPQVKSLSKEWSRSRSRLKAVSKDDTVNLKGAARYATAVMEMYQDRLMPESFKQIESKSAFLAGNYIRYTYFDKNSRRHVVKIPKVATERTKSFEDFWWCPSCNNEGTMEQLKQTPGSEKAACPNCGSTNISFEKSNEREVNKLDGYGSETVGDPDTELVDVREIKVHLRARSIRQTPYLRRRRYVLVSTLKKEFPWAHIKPGKASPITKYIQETELSSGSNGSQTRVPLNYEGYGVGLGGMTEFVQLWIRPSMYFDLTAKTDLKLGDNQVLKAGDSLLEKFPNGLYIAYCGDDRQILDIRDEVMDDLWSHGCYDPLIESFWGDGLEDLLPMQELVNEMQSLFVENCIYNASPKIVYNPWLIEASMFSGNPSEMTPLSKNAKRDTNPKEAFAQFGGMSIAGDVPLAQEAAINTMRTQSGAYLAMSGSNDKNLTTATAMAIARDSAVSQLGPPLALKAETDVRWAMQVLKHIQRNWVDGVHDRLLGQYTIQEAQAFKSCNLDYDIEITVEPGSWTPRTDLEVRNDFLSYVTAGGIPLGFANPQVPYEIKSKAAELFRMPVDLDKLQPDIRTAHMRVEQLKVVANMLMKAGVIQESTENDEIVEMMVADIPVDTYIDDHPVFINTYQGWLKTDEGKFSPVAVTDAVQLLIQRHHEAEQFLSEEKFAEDAKFAMAAQAMQGMVENQTKAGDPAVQAQQLEAGAAAAQAAQPETQAIPLGDQSKRPTTSGAARGSQVAPPGS